MKRRIVYTDSKSGFLEVSYFKVGTPGLSVVNVVGFWNVSHDASGMSVMKSLPSRRVAELVAKRLKGVADWTQSGPKLESLGLGTRCKEIRDAVISEESVYRTRKKVNQRVMGVAVKILDGIVVQDDEPELEKNDPPAEPDEDEVDDDD